MRTCLEGLEAFGLSRGADERREVVAAAFRRGSGELVVQKLKDVDGVIN